MKNEKWVFTFGTSGVKFQGVQMDTPPFWEWFDHPFLEEVKRTFTQCELIATLESRIEQIKKENTR
jgi:hypothetical protein